MRTASAVAEAPSYMLAFATVEPEEQRGERLELEDRLQASPDLLGLVGVYAVANSDRRRPGPTTAGIQCG